MTAYANGGGELDSEAVAELRRLARSRPRSGRDAVAKASALRTLERLNLGEASGARRCRRLVSARTGPPVLRIGLGFLA